MKRLLGAFALTALALGAAPRITYVKSFPRSTPAYVEIRVEQGGRAQYREAAEDENPLAFELTPAERDGIFDLAAKLDHFTRPLESNLKVAFTGKKTFRWENGDEKHEVQFNYSQDPLAQQLWDWFERITESEVRLLTLERAARFDKLGVNQALLQLQAVHEQNRLVAGSQFLPVLDRIIKNASYLHMARTRAAALAEAIRKPSSQASQ
jgi:predicted DCC family thiol-disulfide oxidoreductase YuxK